MESFLVDMALLNVSQMILSMQATNSGVEVLLRDKSVIPVNHHGT